MNPIKITIEDSHYKTVHVKQEQTPFAGMDLTPHEAYALLLALEVKRLELADIVSNYYECEECGAYHRNGELPHQDAIEDDFSGADNV